MSNGIKITQLEQIAAGDPINNDDLFIISHRDGTDDNPQYKSHKLKAQQLLDYVMNTVHSNLSDYALSSDVDTLVDDLIERDEQFVKTINNIGIDDDGDVDITPLLSTFTNYEDLSVYSTYEDLSVYSTIAYVNESITEKINEYDSEVITPKIDTKIDMNEITGVIDESQPDKLPTNQAVIDYVKENAVTADVDIGVANIGVGTIVAFAGIGEIPDNTLLCDGREVSKSDYELLYAVIRDRYGTASDSSKFKLPNLNKRFIEGTNSNLSVGTYVEAGLPNITGRVGVCDTTVSPNGAFYTNSKGGQLENSVGSTDPIILMDASKSNPIYGKSNTVQPPAVMMRYVIVHTALNGQVIVNGGNGGVIDGTVLTKIENKSISLTANTLTDVYTVVNDCYLVMETQTGFDGNVRKIEVYINNNKINSWGDYIDQGTSDACINIPVKAGTVIQFKSNWNATISFNFTEYELHGINSSTSYGSGGVIDGTILVPEQTFNTGTISDWSYTVKNDCMIYIYTQHFIQSFKINDKPLTYNETGENGWLLAPVKANSIITATESFSLTSNPLHVTEYKLVDTNPQVAFPDWDESKKVDIQNGNTIPDNGWITYSQSTGYSNILVNGIVVAGSGNGGNNVNDKGVVPVSRGDIITVDGSHANNTSITFYPFKTNGINSSPNEPYFINVKDFGAKGDGETDDTASIQRAIDAANNYDIIFFPNGTYKISTSINITDKIVTLYGGVIQSDTVGICYNNRNVGSQGLKGSYIKNMTISAADTGISVVYAQGLTIENCNIHDAENYGIKIDNLNEVYIQNCRIKYEGLTQGCAIYINTSDCAVANTTIQGYTTGIYSKGLNRITSTHGWTIAADRLDEIEDIDLNSTRFLSVDNPALMVSDCVADSYAVGLDFSNSISGYSGILIDGFTFIQFTEETDINCYKIFNSPLDKNWIENPRIYGIRIIGNYDISFSEDEHESYVPDYWLNNQNNYRLKNAPIKAHIVPYIHKKINDDGSAEIQPAKSLYTDTNSITYGSIECGYELLENEDKKSYLKIRNHSMISGEYPASLLLNDQNIKLSCDNLIPSKSNTSNSNCPNLGTDENRWNDVYIDTYGSVKSQLNSMSTSYVIKTGRFNSSDGTTHEINSENDSWYREYSDGWCEQGGTTTDDHNIKFYKSYVDNSYSVFALSNGSNYTRFNDKTNNGVQITNGGSGSDSISWEAKGFVQ